MIVENLERKKSSPYLGDRGTSRLFEGQRSMGSPINNVELFNLNSLLGGNF